MPDKRCSLSASIRPKVARWLRDVRLSPQAFNAHLAVMGQQFKWTRAYACPCINPTSGAANAQCQVCFGRGRYWPGPPVDAIAGVASMKVQQAWAQFGLYQQGDTVLSIPENSALYNAGQFDRILAINTETQFSVNLLAGTNDRLRMPVLSINRVFWLNPELTATIDGVLPTIDALGNLTWPTGGGPPLGTTYSVSGKSRDEFFVFMDDPSNRMEHMGARLPKRLVARRFDLFGR